MNRFLKIGAAARLLGVTPQTLRRWENNGTLLPDKITEGGTRYYLESALFGKSPLENDLTIAYARVSSHDQKKDLQRQQDLLAWSRAYLFAMSS